MTRGQTTSPGAAQAWPEWVRHWAKWGPPAAFVISLVVHLAGIGLARYVLVGGYGGGGGGEAAAPVEMAIMTQVELDALVGDPGVDLSTPAVPEMDVQTPAVSDLMTASIGGDLGGEESLGGVGSSGGGGDVGEGLGGIGSGGGGGGGGARFFGVEAQGNRFAYIVDTSGSMDGARITSLKQELKESVGRLLESSQFLIVPFSTDASYLGGRGAWTDADNKGKKWAEGEIGVMRADGGTNPLPGFKIVFSMRPRPDAIYFMTDGEFDSSVVDELSVMNRTLHIPIHCICFGSAAGEGLMKQIAKQSKGTYTYVPGP